MKLSQIYPQLKEYPTPNSRRKVKLILCTELRLFDEDTIDLALDSLLQEMHEGREVNTRTKNWNTGHYLSLAWGQDPGKFVDRLADIIGNPKRMESALDLANIKRDLIKVNKKAPKSRITKSVEFEAPSLTPEQRIARFCNRVYYTRTAWRKACRRFFRKYRWNWNSEEYSYIVELPNRSVRMWHRGMDAFYQLGPVAPGAAPDPHESEVAGNGTRFTPGADRPDPVPVIKDRHGAHVRQKRTTDNSQRFIKYAVGSDTPDSQEYMEDYEVMEKHQSTFKKKES